MMKFLSRLLIIPIILCCFSISLVYAESDCEIFGTEKYTQDGFFIVNSSRETKDNVLSIDEQKNILTKDDLNTAILNLKKYCCEKQIGLSQNDDTCKKDKIYFNYNSLDSSYLFDHLFDVIMRKLSGLTSENDIYTRTKMTTDKKGNERRERINSQSESTKGSTPHTIYTKYQEFWSKSPTAEGYDISNNYFGKDRFEFEKYINGNGDDENSENFVKAIKNYDKRTLYDRYINACALTEYFYNILLKGHPSDSKNYTTKQKSECDNFVKRQIEEESKYVKLVAKQSSNLFLSNYIKGYISYMYERQQNLQKLRNDSSNRFLSVTRSACIQNQCQY